MRDLTGKVAFITGGASGIGFGMAKAFSASGMSVVIADIRQDHLDTAMKSFAGARVHPIRLDAWSTVRFTRATGFGPLRCQPTQLPPIRSSSSGSRKCTRSA